MFALNNFCLDLPLKIVFQHHRSKANIGACWPNVSFVLTRGPPCFRPVGVVGSGRRRENDLCRLHSLLRGSDAGRIDLVLGLRCHVTKLVTVQGNSQVDAEVASAESGDPTFQFLL